MKKGGFRPIEWIAIVVIIGLLAIIVIKVTEKRRTPETARTIEKVITAEEARIEEETKVYDVEANMHTFQVAVEIACIDSNGVYPTTTKDWVKGKYYLPKDFKNPYTNAKGLGGAYELQHIAKDGVDQGKVCYKGTKTGYIITGCGKYKVLALTLTTPE